jgi:anti-sigma regulatory factor (Ser/Thr protein kinase)
VILHIRDPGKGFLWTCCLMPLFRIPRTKHVEVRMKEGCQPGFGILMVQNLVDELLYNERETRFCLSSIFDEGFVA